jgi:hypothetical protein
MSMKTKILGLLAVALLAGPLAANAALVSSNPLQGVTIAGKVYDVTFWQDSSGFTDAAAVNTFPVYFATQAGAEAAAGAVKDDLYLLWLNGPGFDFAPASDLESFDVFFRSSTTDFDAVACDNGAVYGCATVFGASGTYGSIATFALEQSVPEPGTISLLGLGMAGIAVSRRRKA